ncbi:alkane 1-monooxygenase [Maritimibacter sp. 55A14]|uniref:alkane 1-monooxygenase n=1 Tax=Maritimibacter sp. 55A14 TaxID=2174844 RepID=UPI000D61E7C4|nr:alkane 1-monooxygenase [Maritimibacter sp. 55A14]PWE32629.1 alkane 1-monooxygenase [Maritimibacter sp. 55A14]
MVPASEVAKLHNALPFWLSLSFVPILMIAATQGGWTLALLPVYGWVIVSILDAFAGLNLENADPDTPEPDLFWYRLVTLVWFPVEFCAVFGTIWYVSATDHLAWWEAILLFFGVGMISGTVGINYAHELMHQRSRLERWMGDLLMAMALYGHFRSEHLLVHHSWVGTPRDPVTARYNEGFHRFFPRVLRQCLVSSFRAEKAKLARKDLPWHHRSNPFWRYWALQGLFLALAFAIGGWAGLGLFAYQAFIAVWQLEMVNYIEHYGLTREHLGDGRYEHVQPRHSWNAAQKVSNWLLINLQRHSDHHYKPNRRFPLLQNHAEGEAPQLPYGYPAMTALSMVPPLYKRVMNPRVRAWRRHYYPEIEDWKPYNKGMLPQPKGA